MDRGLALDEHGDAVGGAAPNGRPEGAAAEGGSDARHVLAARASAARALVRVQERLGEPVTEDLRELASHAS